MVCLDSFKYSLPYTLYLNNASGWKAWRVLLQFRSFNMISINSTLLSLTYLSLNSKHCYFDNVRLSDNIWETDVCWQQSCLAGRLCSSPLNLFRIYSFYTHILAYVHICMYSLCYLQEKVENCFINIKLFSLFSLFIFLCYFGETY